MQAPLTPIDINRINVLPEPVLARLTPLQTEFLYEYMGEPEARNLLNDFENAVGIDQFRLFEVIGWTLEEAFDAVHLNAQETDDDTDTEMDDPDYVPPDINGNWRHPFTFNGIVYMLWNNHQLVLDGVEVGVIENGVVRLF